MICIYRCLWQFFGGVTKYMANLADFMSTGAVLILCDHSSKALCFQGCKPPFCICIDTGISSARETSKIR